VARRVTGQPGIRQQETLHGAIIGSSPGLEIDHINGNGLDNRRCNLRLVEHSINVQNSLAAWGASRYRGVSWDAEKRRWRATIGHQGRLIRLGRFTDEIEAAIARDHYATCIPGARLNFPDLVSS
jgi:hypothetical protein